MGGYNSEADLGAVVRKVQDRLSALERRGGGWHVIGDVGEPSFQAGWEGIAPLGLRFYKDANGCVILQGEARWSLAADVAGLVTTMPPGNRPNAARTWTLGAALLADGTSVTAVATVTLDGQVLVQRWAATTGARHFFIGGLTFLSDGG